MGYSENIFKASGLAGSGMVNDPYRAEDAMSQLKQAEGRLSGGPIEKDAPYDSAVRKLECSIQQLTESVSTLNHVWDKILIPEVEANTAVQPTVLDGNYGDLVHKLNAWAYVIRKTTDELNDMRRRSPF